MEKKSSLVYPLIFCLRRILLTTVLVVFNDNLFVQVLSTSFVSTLPIWYLLEFRPFEKPLLQKLEIFNEATMIVLVYVLMCFSESNLKYLDTELPFDITFAFFLFGNICGHLFFLLRRNYGDAAQKYKKRCNKT